VGQCLEGRRDTHGVINSVEDLPHDPQLLARGAFAQVNHSALGKVRIVAAIPKMSETPGGIRLPPPRLGEHTDQVLLELGLSRREIVGCENHESSARLRAMPLLLC